MRKLAALTTTGALALTLAACSGDDSQPAPETVTQEAPAPEAAPTSEQPEEGVIGQPVQLANNPGNDVQLTIDDIKLGGECEYGNWDWSENPEENLPPEGKQLLQTWAIVDVVHVETTVGNDWIMLDDPEIVDADGFTQMVEMDINCRDSGEGHQMWSSTVSSGDKMRLYGSFIVPEGISEIRIMGIDFPVAPASTDA